jgi:23S rRNA pseudouridine1911/1915/1917 synthase
VGKTTKFIVPRQVKRQRLDQFLAGHRPDLSRSALKKLIVQEQVLVDGKPAKAHYQVRSGQVIKLQLARMAPTKVKSEEIPLDVFFEDEHLLVVNKPAGLMVHPASGIYSGTLVNALLHHCDGLSEIGGELRPGIVHRLDKDTTGLLMVAKTDQAHRVLAEQLQQRVVRREYRSIVWGQFPSRKGSIDSPIGRHRVNKKKMAIRLVEGRKALTHYRVEEEFGICSALSLKLETGRTHQIRVHLAHLGHPVLGDPKYGGRRKKLAGLRQAGRKMGQELLRLMPRQALHAQLLGFKHPQTGTFMQFEADLPEDMAVTLERLRGWWRGRLRA